jgi:copper chaperone
MKTESIVIANLKCSGCASTIKKELLKIKGVDSILVDLDHDTVNISGENFSRDVITKRLHALGYPEATEENGLLLQAKSYASCMIGKINNLSHEKKYSVRNSSKALDSKKN